ncbi:hypothetical protein [Nostoc sp.]|uniref:hypothetical protein n=1 Tax=Nostoc sp. TaxID=1180 RepID=UPI002FF24368
MRFQTQHSLLILIYVGFGKASNATCYNAGNPRNAVAPQPTIFLQHFSLATPLSCCDYSLQIEAAGEQGAGSKGEDLQVLPNHACDAICRRNSLPYSW